MRTFTDIFQVVRWAIRSATPSAFIPYRMRRCRHPPVCGGCRLLSHPTGLEPLEPVQKIQGLDLPSSKSELSWSSVAEMGFTESQVEHICAVVSELRGRNPKHALSTLTALFVLGLNAASVLKVLEKCPELYTVKEAQLQQRITNLRKLGFVEGEAKVSVDSVESSS